jgi:SAM-dependent methyltransferase
MGLATEDTEAVAVLARRWSEQLAAWAIPEDILRRAPESPWGYPSELFTRTATVALDAEPSPSHRRAIDALGAGGTVLDVGCGAGGSSLPLGAHATRIVGVDESEAMLESFRRLANAQSVDHLTVAGRWPNVADRVEAADVVVCHHVVYNVPDLVPFLDELDRHARRRVVIELSDDHPQAGLNPLWLALHGVERPAHPTADDVVELLRTMGAAVEVERFGRPSPWTDVDRPAQVAFARKRLCVGPDRDAEIDRLLRPTDRRLVTLWWDPSE